MLRELVSRFSSTIAERRASVRKKLNVPVKVCFSPEKAGLRSSCDDLFLSGETTDVSETGIGFVVSSIRIKEKYLVGQDRVLNVELDLGGTKVRMKVKGVRYEKVGIHISTEKYLVGAHIETIDETDLQAYTDFLANGHKSAKNLATVFE
jgi:hypothetical protein